MHEFGFAEEIVSRVEKLAAPYGGKVHEIELSIGELTAIDFETLRFAFDALKVGHPALEQAKLLCNPVPLVLKCSACGQEGPPMDPMLLRCRGCGSARVEILQGRDFDIVRIRVDDERQEGGRPCTTS